MLAILLSVQLGLVSTAGGAGQLPTFSKTFLPDTIGPGSSTTLVFNISNPDVAPVSDLAFVDNLPAGVTIADPAAAATDCGSALLSAPAGGGTITFSGGAVGGGASCSVSVDVTGATPGLYQNITGDLTSSAGNSGTAADDLVIDDQAPGLTKAFSPSSIVAGDISTLTFTVDNTLGSSFITNVTFSDALPSGLRVATPANGSTTCGGTLSATAGSTSVFFSGGFLDNGTSCTVSFDVLADTPGPKGNISSGIDYFDGVFRTAGRASATLDVFQPTLRKLFTDDPAPPGGTVTLEFTITNFDRLETASDIAFDDDLETALSGLTATGLPINDVCGAGSLLSGSSLLIFSGGTLGPEASCTFSVTLDVPAAAAPGNYVNTTSSVTYDLGSVPVVDSPAEDDLVVVAAPVATKSFVDDPVTGGDLVTLSFTVTNTSATDSATDIAFTDVLIDGLPTAAATPGADPCGNGSMVTFTPLINPPGSDAIPARIDLSGGTLPASGECTFEVTLDVIPSMATGVYPNTTSPISATVGAVAVTGDPAVDDLVVVSAPTLRKEFTDDPVLPGGTVTLELTLDLDEEAPANVTDVEFTDDLDAVISGLEAVGLPMNNVCGDGSQLSGTSLITLTDGVLSPGTSCTFSVTLQVPGGLTPGDNLNTTSEVTATSLGLAVSSAAATDDLTIAGLSFSKSFTDDPVVPGGVVTLEFSIDNLSTTDTVTDIQFTDDLDGVLDGLVAMGLPLDDPCGDGSSLVGQAGDTLLLLQSGTLGPETGCTFSVDLQVPASAEAEVYGNITSILSANFGGAAVTVDPAVDSLTVLEPLSLFKSFLDDPVPPGDQVHLQFVVTNSSTTDPVTAITFSDDLDAALSGLAAVGLPVDDVCGAGSQLSGTGLLTLTGGTLPADSSCFFTVTLVVPGGTPSPTMAINVTSEVQGNIGGLITFGDPAADTLVVQEAVCTAIDGESMTFENDTIDDVQSFELCDVAVFGPNFTIVGPNGFLTIQSGNGAILGNGTRVEGTGRLAIGIDESLKP